MSERISEDLCLLTQQVMARTGSDTSGGLLGGAFGYGAYYENDVFMMHPYCWCEREDCQWCGGCDCPESAFHYFVDGNEVSFQGWIDFYNLHVYGETDAAMRARGVHPWNLRPDDYEERSREANRRRSDRHDAVCDYCTDSGIFEKWGGAAPNFYHKPSDLRVHWYKYIGRGMETNRTPSHKGWRTILSECLTSIGQPSIEDAREEYEAACGREAEKFEEAMEWAASPEGQAEFDRMVESGAITVLEFGGEATEAPS